MPIDISVSGDPIACSQAGTALSNLGTQVRDDTIVFTRASSVSLDEWTGVAANKFRLWLETASSGTADVEERFTDAGGSLTVFGDALAAVKSSMNEAREMAAAAGLQTTDDAIFEPRLFGPVTETLIKKYNDMVEVYNAADELVAQARAKEVDAHSTLDRAVNKLTNVAEPTWMNAFSGVTGMFGTAINEAAKWGEEVPQNQRALNAWKGLQTKWGSDGFIAGESTAARMLANSTNNGAEIAQAAKTNRLLSFGISNNSLPGAILSDSVADSIGRVKPGLISETGAVARIAGKVPVLGAGLAVGQTAWDVSHDWGKGPGQIAKDVGSDMGGFVAGTAAMEGTLAGAAALGLAGGPVTLAAVGVGIGVAYGVGYTIDHWDGVTSFASSAASSVGHAATNVGSAVSSAASSVGSGVSNAWHRAFG